MDRKPLFRFAGNRFLHHPWFHGVTSPAALRILRSGSVVALFLLAVAADAAPPPALFPDAAARSCAISRTTSSLLFTPASLLFSCAGIRASTPLPLHSPGLLPCFESAWQGQDSQPKRPTFEHPFWDRENDLLFAGVGASRALDYFSTLNFRRRGRNDALLTNDIVDNHPAFASIEAAATAASIGVSYLFHRHGHHRLERWTSIVHASLSTAGAVRNYSLKTAHP